MAHVFMPKIYEPPVVQGPIAVTITGAGLSDWVYVTVGGVKYTAAASGIEVMPGDVITFSVTQGSSGGYVTIDGTKAFTVTASGTLQHYEWTVPDGISEISIALTAVGSWGGYITVTTS